MNIAALQSLFETHKESTLSGRYITNKHIKLLLSKISGNKVDVNVIGQSVLGDDIFSIQIGKGEKKVLMWSQMHGNESTTTKAIFDFINTCISGSEVTDSILKACTIYIIPILNPDGAKAYTRVNANKVDLNRDAQNLTQPESLVLSNAFKFFKPNFCFNLHGQRTIFSAGKVAKSATISFLAPAQDQNCTVTPTRQIAMEIIAEMNKGLQKLIPNQVGVYDDAFNINCVGDTFQSEEVPTILFEAGHFNNDYQREKTREFIYLSYLISLSYISNTVINGLNHASYFDIPENEKLFYDVIVKNALLVKGGERTSDVAFQFEERLHNDTIIFVPLVKDIKPDLSNYFSHREIDAKGAILEGVNGDTLEVNSENVFVKLNNKKIALFLK